MERVYKRGRISVRVPSRARYARGQKRRGRYTRKFVPGISRTGGYYGRYSGGAGEKKFFDTSVNDAVVAANMTITNLTVIAEGNGESGRIGRKILLKNIHVKGSLKMAAATAGASTSDQVTCMLVQDTQTNGEQFGVTDLLDTDEFKSFRNLSNSTRFKVLYKKIFSLKSSGAAPSGAALIFGEDLRQLNVNKTVNIPIEYDNTASDGTIATVKTNNVYWVVQSSDGICGITANVRLRYTDR